MSSRTGFPVPSPTAHDGQPAVELIEITKRFPGVLANDRVTLQVQPGEAHCLLGENGAGKSTLMSVLAGMVQPDSGQIRVAGRDVVIDSPRTAIDLGIGMVYQHSTLVPQLTVIDNLLLGEGGLMLDIAGTRERFAELSARLGASVDPDAQVAKLALGQQQQVEIVKALWRGSRILILDEPTSMLTPQGVAELEQTLRQLKASGIAIIFITHKLHEALAIGDRVSILRQGRVIAGFGPDELSTRTPEEMQRLIVETMFGDVGRPEARAPELQQELTAHHERQVSEDVLLELRDVSAAGDEPSPGIEAITVAARRGEILGVAGVDGNGQHELAEVIAGQRPLRGGTITLAGRSIGAMSITTRQRLGIRYVTDDRLAEGTVPSLSVAVNLVLKRIGQKPFWRLGRLQRREVERQALEFVKRYDIRTPDVETRVGTLSGGNIQKVLLARELAFDPVAVVYNKPTYGLDLKTTLAVRRRIRDQAAAGVTAIVVSTDLDELLDICDRIAVLYRGRLVGTTENGPGAGEIVGKWMIGADAA